MMSLPSEKTWAAISQEKGKNCSAPTLRTRVAPYLPPLLHRRSQPIVGNLVGNGFPPSPLSFLFFFDILEEGFRAALWLSCLPSPVKVRLHRSSAVASSTSAINPKSKSKRT
ncbi:UNVERIFIED_CONTAM: hypothetical protein Slati_1123500 [Sesamum latifolium]|uniref:Uncharacterized protein n=1 Tax=Sesamum latifolium TaxID=2727402 RepID=A0AAW2XE24_9LAMI